MHSVIGDMVSSLPGLFHYISLIHSFFFSALDYVEGMWKMLQQDTPDDFVLATGETHPVREYVEKAFNFVGIKLRYRFFVLFCINYRT